MVLTVVLTVTIELKELSDLLEVKAVVRLSCWNHVVSKVKVKHGTNKRNSAPTKIIISLGQIVAPISSYY